MSFLIYLRGVVTTSGNGRGGNNRRRPFRRRDRDDGGQNNESRRTGGDSHAPNQRSANQKPANQGGGGSSRDGQSRQNRNQQGNQRKHTDNPRFDKNRGVIFDRLKWIPPKMSTEPLPVPDCPWCGKPIRDIASAIADRDSGEAVHFECIAARIAQGEILEKGDTVAYIGGGRFGVIHFGGSENQSRSEDGKRFTIKKIIEWENKESRAEWRSTVSDHYSVT